MLFVHGFNGRVGAWTQPADFSWSNPPRDQPQSFLERVNAIPGATPVGYNYEASSLEWVTAGAIAKGLGEAVSCLARESGQQVAVIAHSMGGLAMRQVLSDATLAEHVSTVVTLGAPNLGSFWPDALSDADITADAVGRWIALAKSVDVTNLGVKAYSAGLRYVQRVVNECQKGIEDSPSSGICGEVTPIIASMKSNAGIALAAGSQKLSDLPRWPKDGVQILALSSNYTGLGADDLIGDFIVFPKSATAGAPRSSTITCNVPSRLVRGDAAIERLLGCFHREQPRNQPLIALALPTLRDDIALRDRIAIDWKNTSYQATCDGIVPDGFAVTLRDGVGRVSGQSAGSADAESFGVGYQADVAGDLTGDGRLETAVLLTCRPEPSNFFVQEVHVLSSDGTLLDRLPTSNTLAPDAILPPEYVPSELKIVDGQMMTGMSFYGPDDVHATGPSQHRTIAWQWNGQAFTVTG